MADGIKWIELFRENGWLDGNKVVAPDKRGPVKKVLSMVGFSPLGMTDGATIQIDFIDGSRYLVKTKSDTIRRSSGVGRQLPNVLQVQRIGRPPTVV